MNMDVRTLLHRTPLFAGTTDDDLDALLRVCRRIECERGELVFSEGEKAAGFYLVGGGRVKIYKLSAEGKERLLHVVHPGDSFAEAAMFADGLYPANAETLDKGWLVFFPRRDFITLLTENSRIAINMIAGLSRFLRQFAGQIEELTFRDVPARLASYLVENAPPTAASFVLPISKTQLASRLGTVSETLSRTFRKLSDEGTIRVEGKTIVLLDRERLEELAEKFSD